MPLFFSFMVINTKLAISPKNPVCSFSVSDNYLKKDVDNIFNLRCTT